MAEEQHAPAGQDLRTGQSDTVAVQKSDKEPVRDYFNGYWSDTKYILSGPARWNSQDWIEASVILGTSAVLYARDGKIMSWVQDNRSSSIDRLTHDVKRAGTLGLAATVGLGIYGAASGDVKAQNTFLLSTESFIITGAFVQALKHSTGRHRPYTGDSPASWSGPSMSGGRDSFPSGDASSAFAIASVVASEYDNAVVPPLVYGLSTMIAAGRVYHNAHWTSDAFLGSVIGYVTGKAIVASHRKAAERVVNIVPLIDNRMMGLALTGGI
jgi:membrane-associated phospholipid phosphatase